MTIDFEKFGDYEAEVHGYSVRVERDEYAPCPRKDFDNLGRMVFWCRSYDLGDEQLDDRELFVHQLAGSYADLLNELDTTGQEIAVDDIDQETLLNYIREHYLLIPLRILEHGYLTVRDCYDFNQCDGVIYVSHDAIRNEYGWKKITDERMEQVRRVLLDEVKIYDHYLTGSVYMFRIEKNGEEIDACASYYGNHDDSGLNEAIRSTILRDIEIKKRERFERIKVFIRNRVPLEYRRLQLL